MPRVASAHFDEDLRSWQDPTVTLRPLGHAVGADEPSGEASGLLTIREPLPPPSPTVRLDGPSLELPQPAPVQREVAATSPGTVAPGRRLARSPGGRPVVPVQRLVVAPRARDAAPAASAARAGAPPPVPPASAPPGGRTPVPPPAGTTPVPTPARNAPVPTTARDAPLPAAAAPVPTEAPASVQSGTPGRTAPAPVQRSVAVSPAGPADATRDPVAGVSPTAPATSVPPGPAQAATPRADPAGPPVVPGQDVAAAGPQTVPTLGSRAGLEDLAPSPHTGAAADAPAGTAELPLQRQLPLPASPASPTPALSPPPAGIPAVPGTASTTVPGAARASSAGSAPAAGAPTTPATQLRPADASSAGAGVGAVSPSTAAARTVPASSPATPGTEIPLQRSATPAVLPEPPRSRLIVSPEPPLVLRRLGTTRAPAGAPALAGPASAATASVAASASRPRSSAPDLPAARPGGLPPAPGQASATAPVEPGAEPTTVQRATLGAGAVASPGGTATGPGAATGAGGAEELSRAGSLGGPLPVSPAAGATRPAAGATESPPSLDLGRSTPPVQRSGALARRRALGEPLERAPASSRPFSAVPDRPVTPATEPPGAPAPLQRSTVLRHGAAATSATAPVSGTQVAPGTTSSVLRGPVPLESMALPRAGAGHGEPHGGDGDGRLVALLGERAMGAAVAGPGGAPEPAAADDRQPQLQLRPAEVTRREEARRGEPDLRPAAAVWPWSSPATGVASPGAPGPAVPAVSGEVAALRAQPGASIGRTSSGVPFAPQPPAPGGSAATGLSGRSGPPVNVQRRATAPGTPGVQPAHLDAGASSWAAAGPARAGVSGAPEASAATPARPSRSAAPASLTWSTSAPSRPERVAPTSPPATTPLSFPVVQRSSTGSIGTPSRAGSGPAAAGAAVPVPARPADGTAGAVRAGSPVERAGWPATGGLHGSSGGQRALAPAPTSSPGPALALAPSLRPAPQPAAVAPGQLLALQRSVAPRGPSAPLRAATVERAPAGEGTAARGELVPVQRFGLGGAFGGMLSGFGGLEGLKRSATDPNTLGGMLGGFPAALSQIARRPTAEQWGRAGSSQQLLDTLMRMEPKKLQLLAARLYPYVSARIKAELVKDRERAGMITGLHR